MRITDLEGTLLCERPLGQLSWACPSDGTYFVAVSAINTFAFTVTPASYPMPQFDAISLNGESPVTLGFNTISGFSYRILSTDDLSSTNEPSASSPFIGDGNYTNFHPALYPYQGFYWMKVMFP